jgi:hypothetical protein
MIFEENRKVNCVIFLQILVLLALVAVACAMPRYKADSYEVII